MSGRGRQRRGVSAGTVLMLTLTAVVLIGFAALLPKLTGNVDIRINASELAVAIDDSLSKLSSAIPSAVSSPRDTPPKPVVTAQPQSLPTAAPVTPPPKLSFTLSAAGRINLNQAMLKALTDDTGYKFPLLLEKLGDSMYADLSIATLLDAIIPTDKLSDGNMPADMLNAIRGMGVNALCIGHPAVLDSGIDGLLQTKQSISGAGMTPYGAYADASERERIIIVDANGVKVALLGYQNDISSAGKKHASEQERDIALASCDISVISEDVSLARENGAQVVLASVCWGKANASTPAKEQRELARLMADAGVDIIIGTGSDAVQTVEILTANRGDGRYHPTLCAYSMGNLVTHNRDKGAYLAGILLGARVEYDSGTGLVAFDGLTYAPTYCWRGKEDGVTRHRALIANHAPYTFVDKDQQSVMERCLKIVREAMDGGALSER